MVSIEAWTLLIPPMMFSTPIDGDFRPMPSLIITEDELKQGLDILETAIKKVNETIELYNKLEK